MSNRIKEIGIKEGENKSYYPFSTSLENIVDQDKRETLKDIIQRLQTESKKNRLLNKSILIYDTVKQMQLNFEKDCGAIDGAVCYVKKDESTWGSNDGGNFFEYKPAEYAKFFPQEIPLGETAANNKWYTYIYNNKGYQQINGEWGLGENQERLPIARLILPNFIAGHNSKDCLPAILDTIYSYCGQSIYSYCYRPIKAKMSFNYASNSFRDDIEANLSQIEFPKKNEGDQVETSDIFWKDSCAKYIKDGTEVYLVIPDHQVQVRVKNDNNSISYLYPSTYNEQQERFIDYTKTNVVSKDDNNYAQEIITSGDTQIPCYIDKNTMAGIKLAHLYSNTGENVVDSINFMTSDRVRKRTITIQSNNRVTVKFEYSPDKGKTVPYVAYTTYTKDDSSEKAFYNNRDDATPTGVRKLVLAPAKTESSPSYWESVDLDTVFPDRTSVYAAKVANMNIIKHQVTEQNLSIIVGEDHQHNMPPTTITNDGNEIKINPYVDENDDYLKFDYTYGDNKENTSFSGTKVSCYIYDIENSTDNIVSVPKAVKMDQHGFLKDIRDRYIYYNTNGNNYGTFHNLINKQGKSYVEYDSDNDKLIFHTLRDDDGNIQAWNKTEGIITNYVGVKPIKCIKNKVYSKMPYGQGCAPYALQTERQNLINCASFCEAVILNLKYQNTISANKDSNNFESGGHLVENADNEYYFKRSFKSGLTALDKEATDGNWYYAHDLAHYAASHGWFKETSNPSECEIGDIIFFHSVVQGPTYFYPQTSLNQIKSVLKYHVQANDEDPNPTGFYYKDQRVKQFQQKWKAITHCGVVIGKIGGSILVAQAARDITDNAKGLHKVLCPERRVYYSYPIDDIVLSCVRERIVKSNSSLSSKYKLVNNISDGTGSFYDFIANIIKPGDNGLKEYRGSIPLHLKNDNTTEKSYNTERLNDITGYISSGKLVNGFYPGISPLTRAIGKSYPKDSKTKIGVEESILNENKSPIIRNEMAYKTSNDGNYYEELYANDGVVIEFLNSQNDSQHIYQNPKISYITDVNGKQIGIANVDFRMVGFGRFPLNNLPKKEPYETRILSDQKINYNSFNNNFKNPSISNNYLFNVLHKDYGKTKMRTFFVKNPYFDGNGYDDVADTGYTNSNIYSQMSIGDQEEQGSNVFQLNNTINGAKFTRCPFLLVQIDTAKFSQLQESVRYAITNKVSLTEDEEKNAIFPYGFYVYLPVFSSDGTYTYYNKVINNDVEIRYVKKVYLVPTTLQNANLYGENVDYYDSAVRSILLGLGTEENLLDEYTRFYFRGQITAPIISEELIPGSTKYSILNFEGGTQTKTSSRVGLKASITVNSTNPFYSTSPQNLWDTMMYNAGGGCIPLLGKLGNPENKNYYIRLELSGSNVAVPVDSLYDTLNLYNMSIDLYK